MNFISTLLITLLLTAPAMAVELFRYGGAANDGGTPKYIFETDQEKAAEIAAEFMITFYHIQIGALETQEFRTTPVPFWLVSFSDESIKGPARERYFVAVLPDGTIVEPRVARRL